MVGPLYAQDGSYKSPIQPRSFMLGGDVYALFAFSEGDNATVINITPSFGAFVTNGLLIGGDLQFQLVSGGGSSNTIFGIGPKIAYYFDPGGSNGRRSSFYPFVEGSFSILSVEDSYNSVGFGVRGGVVLMISSSVGLDLSMRINHMSISPEGRYSRSYGVTTLTLGAGVTSFIF